MQPPARLSWLAARGMRGNIHCAPSHPPPLPPLLTCRLLVLCGLLRIFGSSLLYPWLRYTPVVCPKPFDFTSRGYKLRCRRARRRIRFFIVITMYNEDATELEVCPPVLCPPVLRPPALRCRRHYVA